MRNVLTVFKRETFAYIASPIAYIIIAAFVGLSLGLTFFLYGNGGFLESNNSSLRDSFFSWHPWLYIVFPALLAMRLWSEENRLGTSEWLFTMPVEPWQAVAGKYLAACFVWFLGLLFTGSIVVTVAYLGSPDYGPIWSGYLASFLYAAACIAITSAVSAFTRSQSVCAILSVLIIFALTVIGLPQFSTYLGQYAPAPLVTAVSYLSLLTHYNEMTKGVIVFRDVLYFFSVIALCLVVTSAALRFRRS